jgi:sugar (pentulose or hexulose) kinase
MEAAGFILLDIGGTYIKSCNVEVGSQELRDIKTCYIPAFSSHLGPEREISWSSFSRVISSAVGDQKKKSPKSKSILISGQMGGFQSYLGELVTWQDSRISSSLSNVEYKIFLEKFKNCEGFARTGVKIYPGLPLLVCYFLQSKTGLLGAPLCFNSMISSTVSVLTKESDGKIHSTDAAASGFYDVINSEWLSEFTSLVEKSFYFPEVTNQVEFVGYSQEFELRVYCGVGDQQASLLGAGLNHENTIVNIGTGGQVAKKSRVEDLNKQNSFRPYFGSELIETITHLPSGRALRRFVEYCTGGDGSENFDQFFELIENNQTVGKLDIVNYDSTLSLIQKESYSKDYSGIAGSFFESITAAYVDAIQSVSKSGEIIFAGGVGQKFNALSEKVARDLKRKVSIAKSTETTLDGLAKISQSI